MSKSWHGVRTPGGRRAEAELSRRVLEANRRSPAEGGNNGMCTVNLPGVCTGTATQAHHVLGKAVTGSDPRYLVASCAPCNQKIGDPQGQPDPPVRAVSRW